MTSDQELQEITQRLRSIHVQRAALLREETSLLDRLLSGPRTTEGDITPPTPSSTPGYSSGNAVYITNRITHVRGRPASAKDRAATVTRVAGRRVYLTTFCGDDTWRLPRNLRRLTREEIRQICSGEE
jgi:hypothetical protein